MKKRLLSKKSMYWFYAFIFVVFSITLIFYFIEKFITNKIEVNDFHKESVIRTVSAVIIVENQYRFELNRLEYNNSPNPNLSLLSRYRKNIEITRDIAFDSVVKDYFLKNKNSYDEIYKLRMNEANLMDRVEEEVLNGSKPSISPTYVYWTHWSKLSKQYWKLTRHYLDFLESRKKEYTKTLSKVTMILYVNLAMLLIANAAVLIILTRKLLIPISRASSYIESDEIYKLNENEMIFSELLVLFDKMRTYDDFLKHEVQSSKMKLQEKVDFLNVMSHEVRTPLNVLIGFVDLIENERDSHQIKKFLLNIKIVSSDLLKLINNILTISKLEANDESIESEIETKKLVSFWRDNIIGLIGNNNIRCEFYYDPDFPLFFSSEEVKIKQAVINMITNSIKAVDGNGIIRIRMKKQDMAIKITVFDSGVGISKYDLDRIGQPFEQVNYNLNGSSSGLGLYMIRKFSESLGGKLNIVSRKNIGTLCSVTIYSNNMRGKVKDLEFDINSSYLPYSNYIKRALWGSYERQIINHSDSYIKKTVLDILECTSKKEPFYEEKIYQLGLNILVAEDYAMNIQVMKSIAKKVGISVVFAKDGQEVVDMYFKDRSFDVIIMDIQMPKLNGFEATAMIREFDKNINIIASSAHLESEVHDDIIASGVSDFLQKPYTIEEFVSAIERNSYLQL